MSEYIDRNELLKTITKNVAEAHNERCDQVLEAILEAPIADVGEVRHGEWGFDGLGWTCSECLECPYHRMPTLKNCIDFNMANVLSLIKELTEENERLKACTNLVPTLNEVKADTVRKMQSEIKERCIKGGIYPAFVASTIDQIAKEMLEGEK